MKAESTEFDSPAMHDRDVRRPQCLAEVGRRRSEHERARPALRGERFGECVDGCPTQKSGRLIEEQQVLGSDGERRAWGNA